MINAIAVALIVQFVMIGAGLVLVMIEVDQAKQEILNAINKDKNDTTPPTA